jgi:proteasome lid subunit RPN8/RPN11
VNGLVEEMLAHAGVEQPREACGLVVARGTKFRIVRARNLAADPINTFDLDPDAWLQVGHDEEVIGIYHSHPSGNPEPSLCDLSGCEATQLPWHIVGCGTGAYRRIDPSGFRAPYLRRPYVYGVHDCWALVRDWYRWEWNLDIPDFHREPDFWLRGQNLFLDHLEQAGFVVQTEGDVQAGDGFLVQMSSPVPNHAVVYLGDGTILHHVRGRLSTRDPWGGYWAKHASHRVRHKSKIGAS